MAEVDNDNTRNLISRLAAMFAKKARAAMRPGGEGDSETLPRCSD